MSKAIVCACEDVSSGDIQRALRSGQRDIESIKRVTGFGTGPCQGKSCLSTVAALLAQESPATSGGDPPFTPRPPLLPTELSLLASVPPQPASDADSAGPFLAIRSAAPPQDAPPLPERARIVIIGGGIMGLALAHFLAQAGERDVVVLEKSYLCAGASGRNGGGVRMQWNSPWNIELAMRSIALMKTFARDTGMNVWLRQGGYLFLARNAQVAQKLERSVTLQQRYGLKTQILTPAAAKDVVPHLTCQGVVSCAYNPEDGVVFPWPFLWGYANTCAKAGIRVETFTEVTGFRRQENRITHVMTNRGEIACDEVVLATGAWSPEVASLADVVLPNRPYRHEILSTEPLKPFLAPLVSVLDSGLYFSQSMRGELVGGMGDRQEPSGLRMGSSLRFLQRFSEALLEQAPQLGRLKVVRQWSGCYDVTPDNQPILGRTPSLPNLLHMSGFVGHGFMMAPALAERMAQWLLGRTSDDLFERFSLDRFTRGTLTHEDMVIG
ncbi:MAG: FAD-dependent oxidoreductase [Myxococcaceae bacterium]